MKQNVRLDNLSFLQSLRRSTFWNKYKLIWGPTVYKNIFSFLNDPWSCSAYNADGFMCNEISTTTIPMNFTFAFFICDFPAILGVLIPSKYHGSFLLQLGWNCTGAMLKLQCFPLLFSKSSVMCTPWVGKSFVLTDKIPDCTTYERSHLRGCPYTSVKYHDTHSLFVWQMGFGKTSHPWNVVPFPRLEKYSSYRTTWLWKLPIDILAPHYDWWQW